MIDKKDILKMVKHIKRRSRHVPDRRIIHPQREWAIGLLLFFVILGVGSVFSASRFWYFSTIDQALEDNDIQVVEYKVGGMQEALRFFDEQTLRFQQIRNGIIPVERVFEEEIRDESIENEIAEEGEQEESEAAIESSEEEEVEPVEEVVPDTEDTTIEAEGGLDVE